MIRDWKFPGYFNADAELVAQEIEEIGDEATPAQILEKARNENSELHKCFEWNDSVAAEKYRLTQAGTICRMIVVRRVGEDEEPTDNTPLRFFHKTTEGEGYKPSKVVFHKQDEYQALLNRAMSELRAFKVKYSMLSELEEILALID
ncbi:MAG: hypothetical protein IJI39_05680 [Clostridia bacterium]|nr:hypothetical protein [Clostridia bacterium]